MSHEPEHWHPYFHDDHPVVLDEMYYKDFMAEINPNNLPYRDYAPLIPYVRYVGTKQNVMKFFVPNKFNGWNVYHQWVEWEEQVADSSINANEAARLLLWSGNLRLHCPCPAQLFFGHAYTLTQLDAAIIPETRYPHIRNPQLKGIVCKHLRVSLKTAPWHLADMASAIKQQRLNSK